MTSLIAGSAHRVRRGTTRHRLRAPAGPIAREFARIGMLLALSLIAVVVALPALLALAAAPFR